MIYTTEILISENNHIFIIVFALLCYLCRK